MVKLPLQMPLRWGRWYSWERSTPSHLNKLQTQRGQYQNQSQNGGRNNKNSQKGNPNSQSSGISDHPHYKWMERNGHCRACFKTNCKNRACKNSYLECSFCKNPTKRCSKAMSKKHAPSTKTSWEMKINLRTPWHLFKTARRQKIDKEKSHRSALSSPWLTPSTSWKGQLHCLHPPHSGI